MTELPKYTLMDAFTWWTTRWVPLSQSACNSLLVIINNNSEYANFIPYFAGMTPQNNLGYTHNFPNDNNFIIRMQQVSVPATLYNYLEYMSYTPSALLTDAMITMLLTVVNATPEFSPYISQLDGITTENSQQYMSVINQLVQFPLFRINAQQFLLDDIN